MSLPSRCFCPRCGKPGDLGDKATCDCGAGCKDPLRLAASFSPRAAQSVLESLGVTVGIEGDRVTWAGGDAASPPWHAHLVTKLARRALKLDEPKPTRPRLNAPLGTPHRSDEHAAIRSQVIFCAVCDSPDLRFYPDDGYLCCKSCFGSKFVRYPDPVVVVPEDLKLRFT